MPRVEDHLRLAERNHEALQTLIASDGEHAEWIATTAFYKAVQLVEAMFVATNGKASQDHNGRLRRLKISYPAVYKHFRPLYQASMVARYLCDRPESGMPATYTSFTDYMQSDVVETLLNRRLKHVEDAVIPMLNNRQFSRVRT